MPPGYGSQTPPANATQRIGRRSWTSVSQARYLPSSLVPVAFQATLPTSGQRSGRFLGPTHCGLPLVTIPMLPVQVGRCSVRTAPVDAHDNAGHSSRPSWRSHPSAGPWSAIPWQAGRDGNFNSFYYNRSASETQSGGRIGRISRMHQETCRCKSTKHLRLGCESRIAMEILVNPVFQGGSFLKPGPMTAPRGERVCPKGDRDLRILL